MTFAVQHDIASLKLHWLVFVQVAKNNPPPLTQPKLLNFAEFYHDKAELLRLSYDDRRIKLGDDKLPEAGDVICELERQVNWSDYPNVKLYWRCEYSIVSDSIIETSDKVIWATTAWDFVQKLKRYDLLIPGAEHFALYALPGDEWKVKWHFGDSRYIKATFSIKEVTT